MSKQLSISAAASIFALAAVALLAPGSVRLAKLPEQMVGQVGATIAVAAPLSLPQHSAPLGAELLSAFD